MSFTISMIFLSINKSNLISALLLLHLAHMEFFLSYERYNSFLAPASPVVQFHKNHYKYRFIVSMKSSVNPDEIKEGQQGYKILKKL